MATFKDLINKLDRDKEMAGFQITPGGFKAGVQRVKNAPQGSYWVLSPASLKQGQQATNQLIGATGGIKSKPLKTFAQTPLYAGRELMKTHERGFTNIGQGIKNKNIGQAGMGLWDIAKTPLALQGGVGAALGAGAIGGAFSGGINALFGGNVAEGVGTGFTQGLQTRGLTRFTDPIISKAVDKFIPTTGLLKRQLAQRGIAGLGNVGEDYLLSKLEGDKYNKKDAALSFGLGAVSAGNVELANRIFKGKEKYFSNIYDAVKQRNSLMRKKNKILAGGGSTGEVDKQLSILNNKYLKQFGNKLGELYSTGNRKIKIKGEESLAQKILNIYKSSPYASQRGSIGFEEPKIKIKPKDTLEQLGGVLEPKKINNKAKIELSKPQDYEDIFRKYIAGKDVARTIGTEEAIPYVKINPKIEKQITDFREGSIKKANPEVIDISKKLDKVYENKYNELKKVADETGIIIGKRDNYSPHKYKETEQQIKNYFENLYGGRGIMKKRTFDTEAEAIAAGFTPKYNTQAEKLQAYTQNIERLKNNLEFIKKLKENKVLVNFKEGSKLGYDKVFAPGITEYSGEFYAKPEVAAELNKLFTPQISDNFEKTLETTANISKKIQEFTLSGGFPGTPMNAFTVGQMIKTATAFHPKRTIESFTMALNPNNSNKYFADQSNQIKKLQSRNVGISTDFDVKNYVDKPLAKKLFGESIGEVWEKLMNDPTFKRFMPIEQIKLFNEIEAKAIRAGKTPEEAINIGANAVKNFWGIVDTAQQVRKSKTGQNLASTFLFAPKFRESMINFWGNNIKALKNPLALENITNTKYMVGTGLVLMGMNAINKALTGKNMSDNPEGKKMTLLIPIDNKTTIGIPWAPSVGTIPRMLSSAGGKLLKGDLEGVGLEMRKGLSSMVRPVFDIFANEDYFGREIVTEEDSPKEKLIKQGEYLFKSLNHPYIKQAIELYTKPDIPIYQRISMAMEMPIRYYNTESIKNSDFWERYSELKKINEQYNNLKYKNPEKAEQLLSENEDKINEFNLMKGYVKEYYRQKDEGKVSTVLQQYSIPTQKKQIVKIAKANEQKLKSEDKDFVIAKMKGGELPSTYQDNNNVYYTKDNGSVDVIDMSWTPKEPTLTGKKELDKKMISKYKGELTQKRNDIFKLYELGVISQDEAENKLLELEISSNKTNKSTRKKSPTKISIKSISPSTFKFKNYFGANMSPIRIKALKKLRVAPIRRKKYTLKVK